MFLWRCAFFFSSSTALLLTQTALSDHLSPFENYSLCVYHVNLLQELISVHYKPLVNQSWKLGNNNFFIYLFVCHFFLSQKKLLKCEDLLFFSVSYHKLNIFGFLTAGWMKKAIWRCHLRLWKIVIRIFKLFID